MQKASEELAKTRDVSASSVLVLILIVFHLLNAKAAMVSEI